MALGGKTKAIEIVNQGNITKPWSNQMSSPISCQAIQANKHLYRRNAIKVGLGLGMCSNRPMFSASDVSVSLSNYPHFRTKLLDTFLSGQATVAHCTSASFQQVWSFYLMQGMQHASLNHWMKGVNWEILPRKDKKHKVFLNIGPLQVPLAFPNLLNRLMPILTLKLVLRLFSSDPSDPAKPQIWFLADFGDFQSIHAKWEVLKAGRRDRRISPGGISQQLLAAVAVLLKVAARDDRGH